MRVDKNLKSAFKIPQSEIISPLEKNIILILLLFIIINVFAFWRIVREKSDSDETIYFSGKITDINFGKRKVRADLKIEGYHNLIFRTHNERIFQSYYYNGGNSILVNQGKTIEISVLKSDYDWLVKNKFIRKIQFSSNISLEVEDFRILD